MRGRLTSAKGEEDCGRDSRDRKSEAQSREYHPTGTVGPKEEQRCACWNEGGQPEHGDEKRCVSEPVHAARRLTRRPACVRDAQGKRCGRHEETHEVPAENQGDLMDRSHGSFSGTIAQR